MKYLKLFATDNDRSTYEEGDNYTEPYVSLVDNGGDLSYNHIFLLVDKEVYPYPNGKKKATVYYTRTFSSSQVNKYQPWCMPFEYNITEEDLQHFRFYDIIGTTDSDLNTNRIYDKMLPNHAYVIVPLNSGIYIFKAKSTTLEEKLENRIISTFESESYTYEFHQTYKSTERSTIDTPYDVHAMSGGATGIIRPGNSIPSYRWYFIKIPKS